MRSIGALIGISAAVIVLTLVGTGVIAADSQVTLVRGQNEVVYTGEMLPVEEALAFIDGRYSAVYHWDGQAQAWRTYRPGQPAFLSDLTVLESGKVYWIVTERSVQLTIVEPVPPPPPPPPCVGLADSSYLRSYEEMLQGIARDIDAIESLLDQLEANPALVESPIDANGGFDVEAAVWMMETYQLAIGLQHHATDVSALVAPSEFTSLDDLVEGVAGRLFELGQALQAPLFLPSVDADVFLVSRDLIAVVDVAHQEVRDTAAAWCDA